MKKEKTKFDLALVEPDSIKALAGLDNYLRKGKINTLHVELIKIRASQINGCSYCINLHVDLALQAGELPERIVALSTWRNSSLFSDGEKAILNYAEQLTVLSSEREEAYNLLTNYFDEHYIGQVIMTIATINAWNRITLAAG